MSGSSGAIQGSGLILGLRANISEDEGSFVRTAKLGARFEGDGGKIIREPDEIDRRKL